jgi:hypothetical protein
MQDVDPHDDSVEVINLAEQLADRIGWSLLLSDPTRRILPNPASRHPLLSLAFLSQEVQPLKLRYPQCVLGPRLALQRILVVSNLRTRCGRITWRNTMKPVRKHIGNAGQRV